MDTSVNTEVGSLGHISYQAESISCAHASPPNTPLGHFTTSPEMEKQPHLPISHLL